MQPTFRHTGRRRLDMEADFPSMDDFRMPEAVLNDRQAQPVSCIKVTSPRHSQNLAQQKCQPKP
jgi:hypothetical protein